MKKIYKLLLIVGMLSSCSQNNNIEESFASSLKEEINSSSIEESSNFQTETVEESSGEISSSLDETSSSAEEKIESKAKNITNYISNEGQIPLINVFTENSQEINSKEDYVPGYLNIVSQPNNEIIFADADMGIRLRGNSTLAPAKKPYRIKFDKKQSLFGLPKAKSWVLLANYFDKSSIRNYLAYLMANKLDNLDFQPSSIMVELKVNNEYRGLYLLCEQMQTGEGRVDIEGRVDSHDNPSFFVESDDEGRLKEEGGVLNKTYVKAGNYCFDIKYPEGDELTPDVIEFIQGTLQTYKTSIYEHKNYSDSIDLDSFIDAYLIQELFKNPDCNNLSLFYYYDAETELIKAGPVWDFDLCLDAVGQEVYMNYKNSELWANKANEDYESIYKYKNDLVKSRYKEVRDILYTVFEELETVKLYLEEPQKRNARKWLIPGDCSSWVASRFALEYKNLKTVEAHYKYVKTKLENQLGFMDKYLL